MSKFTIQADFNNIHGYTKSNASFWLVLKTVFILWRYDNNPPMKLTIAKEDKE